MRNDSKDAEAARSPEPAAGLAAVGHAKPANRPPTGPRNELAFDLDGHAPEAVDLFSFETFIVGPCNALAREATLALARRRQRSLNQLYLGGGSGMGKSHLARAAATEARRMTQNAGLFPSHPATGRQVHDSGHGHAHSSSPQRRADAGQAYPHSDHARVVAARGRDPRSARRVIYTSAEQFTSDFVSAMRNGRNDEWTRRYRGPIELLIVEDIQTFAGRTKTQEELALTISHVLDSGGRVLLTGDRSPRNLTDLDDCLRAQVSRGFVAELDRPDPVVRRHILRAKAAAGGVHLPAECLDLLVESTSGDADCPSNDPPTAAVSDASGARLGTMGTRNPGASVRDIESVLIQVVTTASLLGRPIDLDLTREAINLKSGAGSALAPAKLSVSEVVGIVAAFFGKRPEALASRSRRRDVLVPRQLAMYLAHRYTDASLTEIGRGLGRDHPAVRNALTRVERQVLENAPMRYQVEALSERIDRCLEDARA